MSVMFYPWLWWFGGSTLRQVFGKRPSKLKKAEARPKQVGVCRLGIRIFDVARADKHRSCCKWPHWDVKMSSRRKTVESIEETRERQRR